MPIWITQVLAILGSLTGVFGAILGYYNFRRGGKDPEIFDLAAKLNMLIDRVRSFSEGIQLNLLGCLMDHRTILIKEAPLTQDLTNLLTELNAVHLHDEMHRWARLQTSDPFPIKKVANKLQTHDPLVKARIQATADFVNKLENLRLQVLRRKVIRKNPSRR